MLAFFRRKKYPPYANQYGQQPPAEDMWVKAQERRLRKAAEPLTTGRRDRTQPMHNKVRPLDDNLYNRRKLNQQFGIALKKRTPLVPHRTGRVHPPSPKFFY